MSDTNKAQWQDVQGEATDKFMSGEAHGFFGTGLLVILVTELNLVIGKIFNTMIGDGNFVGVASKVFDDLLGVRGRVA